MKLTSTLSALSALSTLAGTEAAETILGVYIFHRHGDRTPKALAPTNLTALGYEQVYTSGQYYRSRYLTGSSKIHGMNEDQVKLSQLSVTAPVDNVLQNSAMGFLQGLYPPLQTVQTLANGQSVQAPMDGYQLIPVNTIQTGAGSEDAGWLQDASSCTAAKTSSNNFFQSKEYKDLYSSTKDLYSSVVPAVNGIISADQVSFKNGYIVYDILNVASIHNATTASTPSNSTLAQLRSLADAHEWNLAFNASDNTRAVAGMQLAGEILASLNSTITSQTRPKLTIQFGAYATFLSFFGLAQLPHANETFTHIVDYASSMTFELFTQQDMSTFPPSQDALKIRFLFHNGTASNSSQPITYPLFNTSDTSLPWPVFKSNVEKFAITSTRQWCEICGSTEGSCAAYFGKSNAAGAGDATAHRGGISTVVAGVIGAFVAVGVLFGVMGSVVLFGGVTIVRRKGGSGEAREEKA